MPHYVARNDSPGRGDRPRARSLVTLTLVAMALAAAALGATPASAAPRGPDSPADAPRAATPLGGIASKAVRAGVGSTQEIYDPATRKVTLKVDSGFDLDQYLSASSNPLDFQLDLNGFEAPAGESVPLTLRVYDVDQNGAPGFDECAVEVDRVSVNGTPVGQLSGANDQWSIVTMNVPAGVLNDGVNNVSIQIDVLTGDCWAVQVDWATLVLPTHIRHVRTDARDDVTIRRGRTDAVIGDTIYRRDVPHRRHPHRPRPRRPDRRRVQGRRIVHVPLRARRVAGEAAVGAKREDHVGHQGLGHAVGPHRAERLGEPVPGEPPEEGRQVHARGDDDHPPRGRAVHDRGGEARPLRRLRQADGPDAGQLRHGAPDAAAAHRMARRRHRMGAGPQHRHHDSQRAQRERVRRRQQPARLALRLPRPDRPAGRAHRGRPRPQQRLPRLPRRLADPRRVARDQDGREHVQAGDRLHDDDASRAGQQRLGERAVRRRQRGRPLGVRQPPVRHVQGQLLRPDVRPRGPAHDARARAQRLLPGDAHRGAQRARLRSAGDPGEEGPPDDDRPEERAGLDDVDVRGRGRGAPDPRRGRGHGDGRDRPRRRPGRQTGCSRSLSPTSR